MLKNFAQHFNDALVFVKGGVKAVKERVLCILRSERAQSLVEYALILALIAVVAITMLTGIGQKILQKLTDISNALQ